MIKRLTPTRVKTPQFVPAFQLPKPKPAFSMYQTPSAQQARQQLQNLSLDFSRRLPKPADPAAELTPAEGDFVHEGIAIGFLYLKPAILAALGDESSQNWAGKGTRYVLNSVKVDLSSGGPASMVKLNSIELSLPGCLDFISIEASFEDDRKMTMTATLDLSGFLHGK